jgi:hypothetical protein
MDLSSFCPNGFNIVSPTIDRWILACRRQLDRRLPGRAGVSAAMYEHSAARMPLNCGDSSVRPAR